MSMKFGLVPVAVPTRRATQPLRWVSGCRSLHINARSRSFRRALPVARREHRRQITSKTGTQAFAYTWLTQTPESITPEDVLSSLPLPPKSFTNPTAIPILLVTPAFAQWINTENEFLEKWVNRLYRDSDVVDSPGSVDTVVALVDKLPRPLPCVGENSGNEHVENVAESEGMSVVFVKPEQIQGKVAPPRRLRTMEAEQAALVFSIQQTDSSVPERVIHEVGLRLANTIFINGKENTLFGARWTYNPNTRNFVLGQSIDLSSCVVTSTANAIQSSMELPLHPVGQRRRVITSMGNILRQISKHPDDQSTAPMPASSELETELPRYIAENNILDQRVSVWALVEAPGGESPVQDGSQESLTRAIRTGGKLHRVMSGGGGWGKKQGLLSLDYETSFLDSSETRGLCTIDRVFSHDSLASEKELPSFGQSAMIDDLSELSQVAKAGDYIQFFVSVDADHSQASLDTTKSQDAVSYQFGVVSDIEDPVVQTGGEQSKDLTLIPQQFGALSEKAITYLQPVVRAELCQSEEGLGGVEESRTKVDIPGARVRLFLE